MTPEERAERVGISMRKILRLDMSVDEWDREWYHFIAEAITAAEDTVRERIAVFIERNPELPYWETTDDLLDLLVTAIREKQE